MHEINLEVAHKYLNEANFDELVNAEMAKVGNPSAVQWFMSHAMLRLRLE